ncbi:MAG: hypothetical protein AAF985_09485 [Bacteroidota bacterium]
MLKPKLLCCFLLLSCICFAQKTPTFKGKQVQQKGLEHLNDQLRHYDVYQIETETFNTYVKSKETEIPVKLSLGDQYDWEMQLLENDLRGADYQVQVATESGVTTHPKGPNIAFKAYASNELGRVRLAIDNEFIFGFVEEDGETYYIQPLWYLDASAEKDLFNPPRFWTF